MRDETAMSEPVSATPWAKVVGPCYSAQSLQRELGMTPAEVEIAVRELRLLCLITSDGVVLYPAFQMRAGRIVTGLDAVLCELARGPQAPWMWAQWLNAPIMRPGGAPRRRIDDLAAGNTASIVREARHTATAWSS